MLLTLPVGSFELEDVLEHVVAVLGGPLGVVVRPVPDHHHYNHHHHHHHHHIITRCTRR